MSDLTQLIKNIENWAEARNLIEGSTPKKQFIKLMEEFGELCSGVSKNKIDVVKDSIGDCFVVMVILARQFNQNDLLDDMGYIYKHPNFNSDGKLERSLIDTADSFLSFFFESENRELFKAKISFGFCILGLKEAADYFELDFDECVKAAWDEIKDRKGRMIDGVFVKEGDL